MCDEHSGSSERPEGGDASAEAEPRRSGPESAKEPVELPGGGVMGGGPEPKPAELSIGFGDLVRPFLMMGLTGVGVLPHPDTGQPDTDLAATKHAIATLELLLERTEGNRSADETAMLEQALFELKMQFVEAQRRTGSE